MNGLAHSLSLSIYLKSAAFSIMTQHGLVYIIIIITTCFGSVLCLYFTCFERAKGSFAIAHFSSLTRCLVTVAAAIPQRFTHDNLSQQHFTELPQTSIPFLQHNNIQLFFYNNLFNVDDERKPTTASHRPLNAPETVTITRNNMLKQASKPKGSHKPLIELTLLITSKEKPLCSLQHMDVCIINECVCVSLIATHNSSPRSTKQHLT